MEGLKYEIRPTGVVHRAGSIRIGGDKAGEDRP